MKTVILDTNALMMIFQFKIDINRELERLLGKVEIVIPSSVINELKKIGNWAARASLQYAERYRILEVNDSGDLSIANLAKQLNAYVLTNDRNLRKMLKNIGIKTIYLRNYSHLVVENE